MQREDFREEGATARSMRDRAHNLSRVSERHASCSLAAAIDYQ